MRIWLQRSALIQPRTSPLKFAHLAEKSEKGSISNLSTKEAPTSDTMRLRRISTQLHKDELPLSPKGSPKKGAKEEEGAKEGAKEEEAPVERATF